MKKILVTSVVLSLLVSGAAASTLQFPSSLQEIGASAYQDDSSVTEVHFGSSLQQLGDYAFQGCENLNKVVFSDSSVSIGESAFAEINALTEVQFGKGLQSIGTKAFYNCTGLKTVTFKAGDNWSIGKSAFENDSSIESIHFGIGLYSIEDYAFHNCSSLKAVYFDNSDVYIAPHAFDGCADGLVFYCATNSDARTYAQKHGFICPQYYAFLIGLSYEDTIFEISGTREDAEYMGAMLENLKGTQFETTVLTDENGKVEEADIQEGIDSAFAKAENDCDVSLFFFSGHGVTNVGDAASNGALFLDYTGTDGKGYIGDMEYISGLELYNLLKDIPGKKIVIIDACNSGNFVNRSGTNSSEEFVESFLEPFEMLPRAGELKEDDFYVITACKKTEDSYSLTKEEEEEIEGLKIKKFSYYGLMTAALMYGIGYDRLNSGASTGDCPADTNGDGLLTMDEVFVYTHDHVNQMRKAYNSNIRTYNQKIDEANRDFAVMGQLNSVTSPNAADESKYNTQVEKYNTRVSALVSSRDVTFITLKSLCLSQTVQSFPDKSYQEPANTSPDDVIFIP